MALRLRPAVPGQASRPLAGVELGGTKCVAVLANADGNIAEQTVVPTTDPDTTLSALAAVLADWWTRGRFAALGVASFGPLVLDPRAHSYGRVATTAKPGWNGVDVLGRLRDGIDAPFAFDTDVNGAALAERRWGAARGDEDVAYVTVGTGVGVGLLVNGAPARGFGHCEAGHMRVARAPGDSWPGNCPFHGACVEGLASGSALAVRWQGEERAAAPDHRMWDTVVEALAQLGQALVLTAAPRRILIGGGVPTAQPHLLPRMDARLRELLAGYVESPEPPGRYVIPPGLGDRAGPLGPIAMAAAVAH